MKKYIITANIFQLLDLGISYDISGLVGKCIKVFPDKFHVLKVKHTYGDMTFTNEFDIPECYLTEIV